MRKRQSIHSALVTWLSVALLLMQSLVHAGTDTLERIEWKKAPIRLELVVGQEQRIEFPAAVKVGVPATVQGVLRTQSVNGVVYLLAHAVFGSNRLMVRELDSGRIYLFDVTATKEGGPGQPIQIRSLIHISEPTRLLSSSYAGCGLKKKHQSVRRGRTAYTPAASTGK